MKIVLTGANGMLAKAIKNQFKEDELICTDAAELDITNREEVEKQIGEIKPEIIINCAAYTAVDKAEEDKELAQKINAQGTENLAIASQKNDCILVHISTDYVFGGDLPLENVYQEEDKKAPNTVYGITKLEGEEKIKEHSEKYYIFRTAWLYGDGNNFVRTMLALGKEKESLNVVNDQHGSPTYAVDLASIIAQAIEKKIPYGIYHATNIGYTTWYEFTKKIFELAGITTCELHPVTSEEFIRPAKRPKNSMLSKEKLVMEGIEIPDWEDGLKRYLVEEQKKGVSKNEKH